MTRFVSGEFGMASAPEEPEHRRLHLELERDILRINRERIGAVTGTIGRDNFSNVAKMVACLRARYLETVLQLGDKCHSECIPTESALELKRLRQAYSEAIEGFSALEHALQRGYLTLEE